MRTRAIEARAIGWLSVLGIALPVVGCTGQIGGDKPGGPGDGTETAQSAFCAVDTPIRRMTKTEYNNTVRDLLGDTTEPASAFPHEDLIGGFDNQGAAQQVTDLLAEQYMKAAEGISERATADLAALLPGCDPADGATCATAFITDFGKRAFRRPLTSDEIAAYEALYEKTMGDPDLATFETAIQLIIQAMLQSPHFLYRPEYGAGDPVDTDVIYLSDWEFASRLSYLIWNSMPDQELFDAAEAGELHTPEQLAAQARRMVDDDKARDAIRNFHEQWLLLHELDGVSKDPVVYPAFEQGVTPELWKEEIETFIEHVFLDGGTLEDLLTAPHSYMNADLAAFYGLSGPTGEAFERVELDPERYAGFLTQGAMMGTHAKGYASSPVHRGKFIREQVMCDILPLPPANLVITPPPLDSELTTREQFEEIGNNPDCAGCHALMNPIGFAFENFDGVGAWRDEQNDKPIDATGEITLSKDLDGTFNGPVELAKKLAGSQQVASCVASQWFRFGYGRTVSEDDACSMQTLEESFAASGYNLKELLVGLTQTDAFLYRHIVVPEEGAASGGDQ